MHITPDNAEAAYNLLLTSPPFNRWKLPASDDIVFLITASKHCRGAYHIDAVGRHTICISYKCCRTLDTLIKAMAHEMGHLHEARVCPRWDVEHSSFWEKLADRICRVHSFDRGIF